MKEEFLVLRSRGEGAAPVGVVLPGPHCSGRPAGLPHILRKLGYTSKRQF